MRERAYWNPYLAGLLLGLALLAAFLVAGQGLGASALPKRVIALAGNEVAPGWTAENSTLSRYVADGANPMRNWLVIEVVGVLLGGFIGAVSAGRLKRSVDKGPRVTNRKRIWLAIFGGAIMGIAAGLGRGCTSGQALSGGASMAAGSWAFMMMVFAGGYTFAHLLRRQWL
jgi:uncharacterized protein